jgi:hypothetical protein
MTGLKILPILIFLAAIVSIASAATCAEKSYADSCAKCGFDASGKMDPSCYQGYQTRGTACLFAAYPATATMYQMGSCPAVQICIDRLQECKALYTSGNDQYDCQMGSLDQCFERGDTCIEAAAQDCNKDPSDELANVAPSPSFCDGTFLAILFPLAGVIIIKLKG